MTACCQSAPQAWPELHRDCQVVGMLNDTKQALHKQSALATVTLWDCIMRAEVQVWHNMAAKSALDVVTQYAELQLSDV